jgi:hypothetical protein
MIAILDKKYVDFFNENPKKDAHELCIWLAKFMNDLLRKDCDKNELRFDVYIAGVFSLFNYVRDKDVFKIYSEKFLSRRLLEKTSGNDENEYYVLTQLKNVQGSSYIMNMNKMINDIKISNDFNQGFAQYTGTKVIEKKTGSDSSSIELFVNVLDGFAWPLNRTTKSINFPNPMTNAICAFNEYYTMRNTGRKLNWIHSHGKIVLSMYSEKNGKHYSITTGTLHALILLLFNNHENLTINDITQHTEIDKHIVKQIVEYFSEKNVRLLIKAPNSETYSVNKDFCPRVLSINLNKPLSSQLEKEKEKEDKHINETRDYVIQACIVRIMKTMVGKSKSLSEIQHDVLTQINQFKPDPLVIKKQVEILIDKEYLERDPNDHNRFRYLG